MEDFDTMFSFLKSYSFIDNFEQNVQLFIEKIQNSDIYYSNTIGELNNIKEDLWFKSSEFYKDGAQDEYEVIFSNELIELNQNGSLFKYCKVSTYKNHFPAKLISYQKEYIDAEVIDLIKEELDSFYTSIPDYGLFGKAHPQDKKALNFSRLRTLEFLQEKAKEEGYDLADDGFTFEIISKNTTIESNTVKDHGLPEKDGLKWHKNKRDLIELVEVLIANGTVKGNKENAYEKFGDFFEISLKGHASEFSKMYTERNKGEEIKYVNTFEATLKERMQHLKNEKQKRE